MTDNGVVPYRVSTDPNLKRKKLVGTWLARSVSHLLRAPEEFSHLDVDFVSLSESVDTSTPMGKMLFTVLGAVAELERNLIKERVQMGLVRARKQGKQLGRPRRIFDRSKARNMLQTMSVREVARKLGVSRGVIERFDWTNI